MRIVVVGAGEVGAYLAGFFVDEQHDVTILDTSAEKLEHVGELLDLKTLHGSGTSVEALDNAEAGKADLLLAMTSSDEVNMLASLFGKRLGTKTTIARIANDEAMTGRQSFYRRHLGIDIVINPSMLAAAEATAVLQSGTGSGIAEFGFGRVHLRNFDVEAGSPFTLRPISELKLPGALIVALVRDGAVVVPSGQDRINADDRIFVLCKREAIRYVTKGVGESSEPLRQIMIVGGGHIGAAIARYFDQARYRTKLFEDNRRRAWELADELKYVKVIDSDGADVDVLEEEYIETTNAFVAATGSDEKNIMAAVLARDHGVERTVAVVDKPQFTGVGLKLGLTATLAPRLLAASKVLAFIRGGNINRISLIAEGQAEVMEFSVGEDSKLAGKQVQDLGLPRGIIIGAILRGTKAIIPRGKDHIEAGDSVILFATEKQISYVTQLLRSGTEPRAAEDLSAEHES